MGSVSGSFGHAGLLELSLSLSGSRPGQEIQTAINNLCRQDSMGSHCDLLSETSISDDLSEIASEVLKMNKSKTNTKSSSVLNRDIQIASSSSEPIDIESGTETIKARRAKKQKIKKQRSLRVIREPRTGPVTQWKWCAISSFVLGTCSVAIVLVAKYG